MISQFISAIQRVTGHVTDRDIAEILWLAVHMSASETVAGESGPGHGPDASSTQTDYGTEINEVNEKRPGQAVTSLHMLTESAYSGIGGLGAIPVRAPGGAALPGALALGRALRPFMRRIPTYDRNCLDESATARNIAEQGIWLPEMQPILSRWLDVALVVESSRSMRMWQQTASEVQRLLEQHGAFRDVRTWTLNVEDRDGAGTISLHAGLEVGQANRARRDPRELIDANGRRLILVLSDCVSSAWRTGALMGVLARWGKACPVTLVQVLPQRMWPRTALRAGMQVQVRAPFPGAPNAQLHSVPPNPWEVQIDPNNTIVLPVVTLDPLSVGLWARAMTVAPGAWTVGYILELAPPEKIADKGPGGDATVTVVPEISPEERLRRFRATSSPQAQELASILAAVPVSLPVLRLVQRALLPTSRQSHVAEVLLSGLLEELPSIHNLSAPDLVQYDFRPGIRDLLLDDSLPRSESLRVLGVLSKFVRDRTRGAFDFSALLANPAAAATDKVSITLDATSQPFATVSAKVLRRLGGSYAALADTLEQNLHGDIAVQQMDAEQEIQSWLPESGRDRDLPDDNQSRVLTLHRPRPVTRQRILICYSHKDTRHLERLLVHLKFYEYEDEIEVWSDQRIDAGSHWKKEIERAIADAKVAIMLLSVDFLASKFIKEKELPPLLLAADSRDVVVLPVIVGACPFEDTDLARYQSVNNPARPLKGLNSQRRDVVWMDVAKRVKSAVDGNHLEPSTPGHDPVGSTIGPSGSTVIQAQASVPRRGSNPKTVQDAIDLLIKKGWRIDNQVSRRNQYWVLHHTVKTNPILIAGNLNDVIARKAMQHIIQMA